MTAPEIDIVSIRQLPPFAERDETTLHELTRGGQLLSLPRGERLLSRGDPITGLHVVCEGQVKVYMLSADGNERILQVLQAGQRFGDPMLFDESPSPVFVETLSRCQLAHPPGTAVIAAMQADAQFTRFMLSGLSELIRGLMQDIESCCLMSARQRVGAFLLREAEANGTSISEVHLPAKKWILASMLNLSAETFSRELHGMEAQGLIEISGRQVLLRD